MSGGKVFIQGLFRRRLEGAEFIAAVEGVGRLNVFAEPLLRGGDMAAEAAAKVRFVSRRGFGYFRAMFTVVVLERTRR